MKNGGKLVNLPKENINIVFDDGGIGDQIARMTTVKYILDSQLHITVHLCIPDYFTALAKNLLTHPRLKYIQFSEGKVQFNPNYGTRKTSHIQHTNLKSHLVDHAFSILANKQVTINEKNYLKLNTNSISISKFKLPQKYVIITTGFTAEVREMKAQVVNELSDYVISKGYTPIYLGSKAAFTGIKEKDDAHIIGNFNKEINYSKGLDLRDKTTLLEAGRIISKAKCLIGLDNGLMHLAGCTDIPIVGGFTTVDPVYRMPYRNNELGWNFHAITPPEDLPCRFCQSSWDFIYKHDFRECYMKNTGAYSDIKCVNSLTSDKYIDKLEKIL